MAKEQGTKDKKEVKKPIVASKQSVQKSSAKSKIDNKKDMATKVVPLNYVPPKTQKASSTQKAKASSKIQKSSAKNVEAKTKTQKASSTKNAEIKPFSNKKINSEKAKSIRVKVVKKDVQKVANAIRERAEGISNKAFNADLRYEYINASNPKILLVSAWAYLLFFLPLFICPKDKFARYHANQGLLVLLVSLLCYALALGIYFIWVPLAIILVPIIFLTSMIYITMGINNASEGRVERLPFIGRITIIKSI